MIKRALFLIMASVSFIFAACSSLPGNLDDSTLDIKNRAAEYQKNGISQYNSGRYNQALDFFELAFQLNASIDYEEGIVLTLNSIGRTKLAESESEKALDNFNRALEIAEITESEKLVLLTKGNLSNYYMQNNDLQSALSILNSEIESIENIRDEESAYLSHLYSLILRKQKKYSDALEYLNRSLKFNLKNKLYRALAADYYMLASVYSLQENYSEALSHGMEALKYDKMIEYSLGIAEDLEALSIISEKAGDRDAAKIYNKRAQLVFEAIANINQIEKVQSDLDNNQSQ